MRSILYTQRDHWECMISWVLRRTSRHGTCMTSTGHVRYKAESAPDAAMFVTRYHMFLLLYLRCGSAAWVYSN